MFYYYFRFYNWFSSIFGLHFPFPPVSDKVHTRWLTLWSFIVSASFIVSYFYPNNFWPDIKVKTHLDEISRANNVIVNVIIILLNICNGGKNNNETYEIVCNLLDNLQLKTQNVKLLAVKFYIWMTPSVILFITAIIMEMMYTNPPFTLIIKMPIFLCASHLILHLAIILATLKVVNERILEKFKFRNNFFLENTLKKKSVSYYLLCPTIKIFEIDSNGRKGHNDLYLLCKIYDEIGICMNLLEKSHGIQIVLSIWLMFSNAVTSITLITKERTNMAWIVVVRSVLPFFWYFMGCYVDNQLRQEVEQTELLIVKHLIDFRCDHRTREALQIFRQVLAVNRLEFKACNLFGLNYSTMLSTVVSVITYSIILIQVL